MHMCLELMLIDLTLDLFVIRVIFGGPLSAPYHGGLITVGCGSQARHQLASVCVHPMTAVFGD